MNNNNKWGALSMKDRAFLIRQAVKNGITDIGSIKEAWEHRFDGEENQTEGDTPWYQKMLNFLGETASMRRDARTGNVGATIVRDLYDSGNKEKADELSSQILAANLAGMALATGAAAVPASAVPTTGMEAVNLLHTVNIPMKQKLAQNAVNVLGSLVGGEFINRTSQAFGYEGFGDAAYSTVMPNKTNRTPVDNVLISALDAFNPGYYVGISGIKSMKGLRNTNAAKSKKSKLTPDEKFKKALANYTEGADYVFYDPVKLRQRLRKEGVSPELLTDDNLKNLIHNRATSLERISSVPKFAIRQPYGPGYQYNLYYANNNPANVGYIEITPGHVGLTPANRINMVRNSSGWNSKTPVKGVSETAYNAVINDLGSVVSGENLQSAHITEKVLSKFNNKKVINNRGFWTRDGKLTVGNPVYELTTPTFDVPTGYEDDFSLEAFDDSGHFINNISRGPIYKNGGKTNTIAKTDLSHATDDSFIEKLAYNIGSNPRVKDAENLYQESHQFDGESDQRTSGILDKERIVRNIPAREFGPYTLDDDYNKVYREGTTFWKAPLQYLSKKQLGKQNEDLARQIIADLENTRPKEDYNIVLDPRYHSYEDAIHYLDHVEGLRKYLGLPYNTNTIKESEYKPTRLQGTNEKTYKFASSEAPGYWDEVVDDMVNYGRKEKQYIDATLNKFTAYRDRDEKGDFVSIYDEWDYNPSVRGGNKKLNKVIDIPTGGKGFVVYDRIYLDDYYNIPKEGRGGVYIDPIVVTSDNSHQFSGNQHNLERTFKSSYPSTTISEKADYQVISAPLKYTYPEKDLSRQLDKRATVQDFSDLMYPIIQQEMAKNNYPMENIDNTMRQIALESNYGRDTRGNGFNYAGIKVQGKDKKKLGTRHSDGFYYRNFDNNAHFADWYLDLLNNRYDALNATSKKDYINRLHDGRYKYSANKKSYRRNFYNMSSLENALKTTKKNN